MKQGIFYGVGVGPGDPELLTLKAVRLLQNCPVIATPQTRNGEMLALEIASQAVDLSGKTILPLQFPMQRNEDVQRASHQAAAQLVAAHLQEGHDVAMLNLGDVSIYSTYAYLMDLLKEQGFVTEMIPAVPSFCAVAARLGQSLTSMNAPLHIIPASGAALEDCLSFPGAKILMKSGSQMPHVREVLRSRGLLAQAAMVRNCGLPGEAVYHSLADAPEQSGYFSTILLKE